MLGPLINAKNEPGRFWVKRQVRIGRQDGLKTPLIPSDDGRRQDENSLFGRIDDSVWKDEILGGGEAFLRFDE